MHALLIEHYNLTFYLVNKRIKKPRDGKGWAVVIMDSVYYEQIIYKNLDKNIKKVDLSCDNKTMRASNALIKMYEVSFLNNKLIL